MSISNSLPIIQEDKSVPFVSTAQQTAPLEAAAPGDKKLFIDTYGCQMNEHDSLRMGEQLRQQGFKTVSDPEQADLVLINTCSVRELAVQKAFSQIGRLRSAKERQGTKIAVTGCVAQLEGESLLRRFKEVDLVLGPDNIYQLSHLVERVFKGERLVKAELDESPSYQFLTSASAPSEAGLRASQLSAFVTVQKGCDKNCSYCIVPSVRGREVSRSLGEILDEIKHLVSHGVVEMTLLGQNIDAYHDAQGHRFDTLLSQSAQVEGLKRLRFTTGHPNDFNEAMANAMASHPAICEHLHLPAQSGSDTVLKRMYRGYSRQRYLEKVAMVHSKIADMSLTTDLIVGFPGETEQDFEATLELVELAQFDSAFCYSYSVRPNTKAAPWVDDIPENIKRKRLNILIDAVKKMALKRAQRFIGRTMEVLVEGPSRTNPNTLTGRIRHNTVVNFEGRGDIEPGDLVGVQMLSTTNGFSLWGQLED